MSTTDKEILINTEAMNSINTYTMELKEKLTTVLEDISKSNKQFVDSSAGKFSDAFGEKSVQFEKEIQTQIDKLNVINQFAKETLELQTELDEKIAATMIN